MFGVCSAPTTVDAQSWHNLCVDIGGFGGGGGGAWAKFRQYVYLLTELSDVDR